jgi:glutamate-1-semialdehyde aminotransferase
VAHATGERTSGVDRRRVAELTEREATRFITERPRSAELLRRGSASMPRGVPMAWMTQLFGHPAIFMDRGEGPYVVDVDGHRYLDTNIADTSMFCGYSPEPVVEAVRRRIAAGPQFLMPTEDAIVVAEELARRWHLPKWQFTLSATSANTEAFRIARHRTGRSKILMFAGKYHGHADEMLVTSVDGRTVPEFLGLVPAAAEHTILVDFNDLHALERVLAAEEIACVVTEPALTNVGVIVPDPGFHASVRSLTREHGTLLIYDETHTLICGPGGLVRAWGLEPDLVTVGKSIGGGVAIGAYGMSDEVASALQDRDTPASPGAASTIFGDEVATGGTLFGNALQMAAARAALTEVLTDEAYDRTSRLGEKLADGIDRAASRAGLPWCAHRLVARAGYQFDGILPRTASEAHAAHDPQLYRLLRLFMANRGVWEAMEWAGPAVSVAATDGDIAGYLEILDELVGELAA